MKNSILLLLALWFIKSLAHASIVSSAAPNDGKNSCFCTYKLGNAKELTDEITHWWGSEYKFFCDYNCKVNNETKTVRGNHSIWFVGDEEGNEYVCEGTIYRQKYSTQSNWWYYDYEGSRAFNPNKSKSSEIRAWAQRNNCR